MSDKTSKKPSIFQKVTEAATATLDSIIEKGQTSKVMNEGYSDDFMYAKTLTETQATQFMLKAGKKSPTGYKTDI